MAHQLPPGNDATCGLACHTIVSLESARRVLGYQPEDDSQVRFADRLSAIVKAPSAHGPRPWE